MQQTGVQSKTEKRETPQKEKTQSENRLALVIIFVLITTLVLFAMS